jgi:hypothetical protein
VGDLSECDEHRSRQRPARATHFGLRGIADTDSTVRDRSEYAGGGAALVDADAEEAEADDAEAPESAVAADVGLGSRAGSSAGGADTTDLRDLRRPICVSTRSGRADICACAPTRLLLARSSAAGAAPFPFSRARFEDADGDAGGCGGDGGRGGSSARSFRARTRALVRVPRLGLLLLLLPAGGADKDGEDGRRGAGSEGPRAASGGPVSIWSLVRLWFFRLTRAGSTSEVSDTVVDGAGPGVRLLYFSRAEVTAGRGKARAAWAFSLTKKAIQ